MVKALVRKGLLAVFLAAIGSAPVVAAPVYVLGDSIGADVGRVAKQQTLARISVSLGNRWIYKQLPEVPRGSTVVMLLGTNDADYTGPVSHVAKHVDALVEAARAADLKLYWLGPICVTTASDARSAELDKYLASKLAGTGVTYISLRKPALCDPTLHDRDGIHMRDTGSRAIWQKAVKVAGLAPDLPLVASRSPAATVTQAPAAVKPVAGTQVAALSAQPLAAAPVAAIPAVAPAPAPAPVLAKGIFPPPPPPKPLVAAVAQRDPVPLQAVKWTPMDWKPTATTASPVIVEIEPVIKRRDLSAPASAQTTVTQTASLDPAKPASLTPQDSASRIAKTRDEPKAATLLIATEKPTPKPATVRAPHQPMPSKVPSTKSCFFGLFSC